MNAFFQVVAFAETPSQGNPAAVFVLDEEPSREWIQKTARLKSQPIHSFVWPAEGGVFKARFHTPEKPVPLSGHGALSAAHGIWQSGRIEKTAPVLLDTLAGPVELALKGDRVEISMDKIPCSRVKDAEKWRNGSGLPGHAEIFYIDRQELGFSILAVLKSFDEVSNFAPDLDHIRQAMPFGLIVTALSERESEDFASRFFVPSFGIDEDSVTGIAHAPLFPFWGERLGLDALNAYQASARGGFLYGRNNGPAEKLSLQGKVLTISEEQLP